MSPEPVSVHVHLLPSLIPPGSLAGGVAVVVDVLRATTVMAHALASGCAQILPCGEIEEAQQAARSLPLGSAILGGERKGMAIPGFHLGNSPSEYRPEVCRGKTLVMTTTNGTRALLACMAADRVFAAAFVNLRATLNAIESDGRPVHIVCAGTDGQISYEDSLMAGALARSLMRRGGALANDEAILTSQFWQKIESLLDDDNPLERYLRKGRGGQNVAQLGLEADIVRASRIDDIDLAAELHRDPLRITAAAPVRDRDA